MFASGAHALAPQPIAWTAAPGPFQLSFTVAGKPLAAEADTSGGPGGRLSYRLADGSFHGLGALLAATPIPGGTEYRVATDEPLRTATVDVTRTPTGAAVSFSLTPSDGVVTTFEAFAAVGSEHFLGGGERPAPLDLRGHALAIKTAYACQSTMPAPFYLSTAGYGVSLRTSSIAALAFPGAVPGDACAGGSEPRCPLAAGFDVAQVCALSPSLAYDLFAGSPEQIVSAYTQTIGRPQLPPVSQFALVKWRDVVGGPSELFEDVDKLRALHIPIGWVLLDNPWESGACYGTMTFDSKFGDPVGMIRDLHARGVRFMLWISPLVRRQFCPSSSLYPQSSLLGTGKASTIDLTDPAALSTFESSLRTLIGMGVDGFKADRGDEIDLEPLQLAGGSGGTLHNDYPLLYARAVAAAIHDSGKDGTFATIFRSGAPGSSAIVPGFWAGDQDGTFAGLVDAIHDGLSAGVAGYAIWGSDTGGYGPTVSGEVLVRWAQFSAVSPVFEVGGSGGNSTFWNYDAQTVSAFRDAAVLHYELFPYLYELARAAHETGVPVLRPLALEYPNDPLAWQAGTEVLVGRDLLEAPVTATGDSAPVYLPAGSWLDLATGVVQRGGRPAFTRPTPLDEVPLYLRAGAAIPFAPRPLWPTDALQAPGRAYWIYAPGPGVARSSAAGFGTLTARTRGKTVTLGFSGAPRQTWVLVAGARGATVQKPFAGVLVRVPPGARQVVLTLR